MFSPKIAKMMTRIRSNCANALRAAFNTQYNLTEEADKCLHSKASKAERKMFAKAVDQRTDRENLDEDEFLTLILSFMDDNWGNDSENEPSPESLAWAVYIVSHTILITITRINRDISFRLNRTVLEKISRRAP